MAKSVRSILVLRPAGLGDFIMSSPAFVALRAHFPAAKLSLLTLHSQSADQAEKVRAYAGNARTAPWIELIRPHALDDVYILPPINGVGSLLEARRVARTIAPDLIVHMFDPGTPYLRRLKKIVFMFAVCGFVKQIGWRQHGQIHPGRPPAADPHLGHHVTGPLQFARELGASAAEEVTFDIRPGAAADAWAAKWIAQSGLAGRRLVAVAPGAIHDHKQWPLEKFAELIGRLDAAIPDLAFLIVGSPKDSDLANALVNVLPDGIRDLCGISIAQSTALFRHCALVVGNDGGAMHLADAVGAKVVSIVPGLEYPNSIEPWHNQERAVRHPVPCAPCYSFTTCPQGHRKCMLDLPISHVYRECARVLSPASGRE